MYPVTNNPPEQLKTSEIDHYPDGNQDDDSANLTSYEASDSNPDQVKSICRGCL